MPTFLSGFRCPLCGAEEAADADPRGCGCGGVFEALYDLERARRELAREDLARRGADLWRYRELLPLRGGGARLSLGEGGTPLVGLRRLGAELRIARLLLKDESRNPTGSFKARGLALAVAVARERGAEDVALSTAGNAGGACAAYAAAAGIRAHVFVPDDASPAFLGEIEAHGADLRRVRGSLADAGAALGEALRGEGEGWRNVSVPVEPHRIEGKKTMAYELAEQLGWRLPRWIVFPTGGGVGIVAHAQAIRELRALGWVEEAHRSRLVAVQAEGCAPLQRAFASRAGSAEPWGAPDTVAEGLRVPVPSHGDLVLREIRESGGVVVAVSEEEILDMTARCAHTEGLLPCPEGAAALAGLARLAREGQVAPGEDAAVYNTATPFKYPEALRLAAARAGRTGSA